MAHLDGGGHVGIVPASLHETVLDVDSGNPDDLHRAIGTPRAVLDSLSRQGAHSWYDDTAPRPNGTFDIAGCTGDIRSGRGFVVIRPDQFDRLVEGLRRQGRYMVQDDIFAAAARAKARTAVSEKCTPPPAISPPDPLPLETCTVGCRNQSLFDTLRHAVYPIVRGDNRDDWHRFVLERALDLNSRLPDPLPVDEVRWTAYSISTWCWNREGHIEPADHSYNAQWRRGIKRHYGDASHARQRAIRERNGLICDLQAIGWKQRDIAARAGVTQGTVSRVIGKADGHGFLVAYHEPDSQAEPWKVEGISRRTWYYRKARKLH